MSERNNSRQVEVVFRRNAMEEVGPGGDILDRTWAKAGLAVAGIDVAAEIERARRLLRHLEERRPDAYRKTLT